MLEGKNDEEQTFFLRTLIEMVELHQKSNGSQGFDFESAVAHAFIFLVAGFDTTANLLMWATYYLAMYPDLQEEIVQEIEEIQGPGNKEVKYEDLKKFKKLG